MNRLIIILILLIILLTIVKRILNRPVVRKGDDSEKGVSSGSHRKVRGEISDAKFEELK